MAVDVKELDKLIRIGEGYTMEFKTSPSHIGRDNAGRTSDYKFPSHKAIDGPKKQGRHVFILDNGNVIWKTTGVAS